MPSPLLDELDRLDAQFKDNRHDEEESHVTCRPCTTCFDLRLLLPTLKKRLEAAEKLFDLQEAFDHSEELTRLRAENEHLLDFKRLYIKQDQLVKELRAENEELKKKLIPVLDCDDPWVCCIHTVAEYDEAKSKEL